MTSRLSLIMGVSVATHLGIAIAAWLGDLPTPPQLVQLETTYVPERELPGIVIDAANVPDVLPGAATPVTPSRQIVPKRPIGSTVTMSKAEAQQMAAILSGGSSSERRAPGSDLEAQLSRGTTAEIGASSTGFRAEPGVKLGTGGGPSISDPIRLETTTKDEKAGGRIQIKPLRTTDDDSSTLTVDAVLAKINGAYMSGLTRCYANGLAADASLSGKIAMSFSVTERGSLEAVTARGVSSDVDTCVGNLMSSWRFTVPRDTDGAATEQSFSLSLQLTPN